MKAFLIGRFPKTQRGRYNISDSQHKTIGNVNVIPNAIKGKYEYWGVFFASQDVALTKQKVLDNGGSLIYEDENLTALADPFGAFFHLTPIL